MGAAKREILLYAGIAAIIIVGIGYLLFNGAFSTSSQYNQTVGAKELSSLSAIANNQSLARLAGTGAYDGLNPSTYFKRLNSTPLMYGGKPEILYVGAEFCPYCAATKWAMILALMRFGNFTGMTYSESSPTDVFPNTPTFSFLNYSYASRYLSFNAFETETRTGQPLQQLDPTSSGLFSKYGNAIPFMDFGNYFAESGAVASPGIYKGLSWSTITSQLSRPNTTISQDVIGAANIYTAEICYVINNTAPACSQSYIRAAGSRFLS